MFGHMPELIFLLVIALIVFGPEKLPEMAHNAGKMVRELRQAMDSAMNPEDVEVPDDFSTYYYESLQHSGEEVPEFEEDGHGEVGSFEYESDPAAAAGHEDLASGSIPLEDPWDEPH